jgi:periplasmic protein TonB
MAALLHCLVAIFLLSWDSPDPSSGQEEAVIVEIILSPVELSEDKPNDEPAEKPAEKVAALPTETETPPPETLPEPVAEPLISEPIASPLGIETTDPEAAQAPIPIPPLPEKKPVQPKKRVAPRESPAPTLAKEAPPTAIAMPQPPVPVEKTTRPVPFAPTKGHQGATPKQNTDAVIRNYTTLLQAHLAKHLRYPPSAKAQRRQGALVVRMVLGRHGNLVSWRIVSSSGQTVFDRETEALLERASPFPPLPSAVSGETVGFIVPVRYSLRKN